MCDRKWLKSLCNDDAALHSGPFIKTKSRAPICDTAHLKCAACLCAKALRWRPSNASKRSSPKDLILKRGHLMLGDCISADHFFSPVNRRLLHTYGCKRKGYTCGSLFVDHASGKIFRFPQFSTNASKTIKNTLHLESMEKEAGIEIKQYHSDNGIFCITGIQKALR
jgi:hypothetical protein